MLKIMHVSVRFFASLREELGMSEKTLEVPEAACVSQVWEQATQNATAPDNMLCAVNYQYVSLGHRLQAGDEVAFFPPVTGG